MVGAGALAVLALGVGVVTGSGFRPPVVLPVVTGKLVSHPLPAQTQAPASVVPSPPASAQKAPSEPPVRMTVVSEPPGARVVELSSGRALGTTPLSAIVPRSSAPSRLRLERAGRRPTEVEVVPDAELEVRVALPRTGRTSPIPGKLARNQKHPDPFKL
jgi:hypothetical protein